MKPKVLFMMPPAWASLGKELFASPAYDVLLHGKDEYRPGEVDYFVGFRPPPGFLKSLTNLKLIISMGAGVDGFLADPQLPRNIPLVRFTDPSLAYEMAQYVTMHALIIHRHQRFFDAAQAEGVWRQLMMQRATDRTHIGILGLGEIGGKIAERLALYGFPVSGWSKTRKNFSGVKSFAGNGELGAFLGQCDILACVLPQTPETVNMVDRDFLAQLPKDAWLINVARGSLIVEADLIAALDSGHLGGAVLDVFRVEPLPQDSPIWRHPKITVTPHVAGLTDPRMALAYVESCVTRWEAGQPLADIVDLDRGY
ncbi:MAG TPA: glyoxylate/hydroxypyruvate reductase A [Rhizomicrobium sp.]|nr:glyoxylate/hydroxypyruvate reductase A [Rhizomicrobium sp.]